MPVLNTVPEDQRVPNCCVSPAQGATCLFLVWDDVLFPSTELFHQGKAPLPDPPHTAIPRHLKDKLSGLSKALEDFLREASAMSDRAAILCFQPRGWVEKCVGTYLPELLPALSSKGFQLSGSRMISVLYVHETMIETMEKGGLQVPRIASTAMSQHSMVARRVATSSFWQRCLGKLPESDPATNMASQEWWVAATLATMKFWLRTQAHGRPWRSLVCISATMPSLIAAHLLGQDPDLRSFVKSIRVPVQLPIEALSLRLRFDAQLLPVYALYGADFKVNMTGPSDPPTQLASTLLMPQLQVPYFSRYAWGLDRAGPSAKEVKHQLGELRLSVSDGYLFSWPAGLF